MDFEIIGQIKTIEVMPLDAVWTPDSTEQTVWQRSMEKAQRVRQRSSYRQAVSPTSAGLFMAQTHYKLWYRINAVDRFLLWYSNEHDGIVVDSEGCIPSFRTESALLTYADTLSIAVQPEEPLLHDLYLVQLWLANPQPHRVDPPSFLSAWNLFGDVARTLPAVGARFTERDSLLGPLYDKLFWANNLPSMTPEGEGFAAEWSTIEIGEFTALLREGLDMFIRSLREAG